ncbi:MAG: hypothetical protein V8T86_09135 [Victivallis sp.]
MIWNSEHAGRLDKQFHRIAGHRGIRRYGANTLWMLAEKGCRLVFGFLVGIYVARQLGPAGMDS